MLKVYFSRRWLIPSIIIIAAMAVMARLGIWQLDRLQQRRASNAITIAQMNAPTLDLNTAQPISAQAISGMQYRKVVVTGTYDFSQQVGLRNQVNGDTLGVHLLTPLHISGTSQTILIDRGWVPEPDFETGNLAKYDEPGSIQVSGVIETSIDYSFLGFRSDPAYTPGQHLSGFNSPDVARVSRQIPYPVLPVYILQTPDPAWTGLPKRTDANIVISDGPHLSYAIQWFSFALILGSGYFIFVRRTETTPQELRPDIPDRRARTHNS